MGSRAARTLWLLALGVALVAGLRRAASLPAHAAFHVPEPSAGAAADAAFAFPGVERFASSGLTPSVHSATAVELASGRLRAYWYGGTREGAKDVAIYGALFDPETGSWSAEKLVTSRRETRDALGRYIRKLGNPVVGRARSGRLWLFYVSVSMGGWSGSAINVRASDDGGATWTPPRRLVTSPFLNVGTLVRGPMLEFEDGTLGLPVYHELLGKFGELLRLDAGGRLLSKTRLSWGRSSLQPVVVPFSPADAVAFFRTSGSSPRRVLKATTRDAGRTWSALSPTLLLNPDAAVAALRAGSDLLLAFNDSAVDRSNLTIARSADRGDTFDFAYGVPPPGEWEASSPRFAYPWLLRTRGGDVHLLYTWNRERIVHLWFRR